MVRDFLEELVDRTVDVFVSSDFSGLRPDVVKGLILSDRVELVDIEIDSLFLFGAGEATPPIK
jgi:ethanolamine utilization cobalamin adenosyltransferase